MKERTKNLSESETLQRVGLRATRQRVALLKALTKATGPLSVEVLTKVSKGEHDLTTAYRILDAFILAGLARRIELAQGFALYELEGEHHHHAVCISCGCIRDVRTCIPTGLDTKVAQAVGFASIHDHSLEFFGLCSACANR